MRQSCFETKNVQKSKKYRKYFSESLKETSKINGRKSKFRNSSERKLGVLIIYSTTTFSHDYEPTNLVDKWKNRMHIFSVSLLFLSKIDNFISCLNFITFICLCGLLLFYVFGNIPTQHGAECFPKILGLRCGGVLYPHTETVFCLWFFVDFLFIWSNKVGIYLTIKLVFVGWW